MLIAPRVGVDVDLVGVLGEAIDDHFPYDSCVIMRGLQEYRVTPLAEAST